jgi:hypothetical protein
MMCLRENNQGADLLIGYMEGTLPAEDRRNLELHAAECAECRGLLAVQATLGLDVAPEVSANFDAKLYARIAADQARRPWWSLSWKMVAPAVAMAAALVITVWVRQPVPQTNVEHPAVAQDVQQLEQALDDLELLMPLESKESI